MLFAWNDKDPVNVGDWAYHGQNRRVKIEDLFGYKEKIPDEDPSNLINHDFLLKDVRN